MIAAQDTNARVKAGKEMEARIAAGLRNAGLKLSEASDTDDRLKKVDRWIETTQGRKALQIKYRESGSDLLFEVFDTFHGWRDSRNKTGRDMQGIATEYAVLLPDQKTVVMVDPKVAKEAIEDMLDEARCNGWSRTSFAGSTLNHRFKGFDMELKLQHDPADGRKKIVAYIPAAFFEGNRQTKVYKIALGAKNS
jgi:hypothetical protein